MASLHTSYINTESWSSFISTPLDGIVVPGERKKPRISAVCLGFHS
jgi:hypothetical protein